MAQKQKRPSPLEEPPTASSSDSEEEDNPPSSQQHDEEEEEDEEEASSAEQEEEEDDDDDDQPASQPASKNPPPTTPSNSNPKPPSSDSETETDSESESDSDQPAPSAKVKPLASKPMDHTPKPKAQAQVQASPSAKRPAENNGHATDPKRAKKKGAAESDDEDGKKSGDESKKLFQRLWSEEDEIAILRGMIEFTSKAGVDPYKYANALHDFLNKTQSLRAEASTNQLKQKIRRLKSKFENNVGKTKNGEGPKFSKAHEQKAFELSKKIWGNAVDAVNGAVTPAEKPKANNAKGAKSPKKGAKSKPKPEAKPDPKSERVAADSKEAEKMEIDEKANTTTLHLLEVIRLDKGMGLYGLNENVMKRGLELMGASKRAELEEQWKELQVAELELYMKRAELVANQARLILEAYQSSYH